MTWQSLPYEPREIKATEARIQRIYDAARLGLKGDALALAAGLLPTEYRRLCQFDAYARLAEDKGRADGELAVSTLLHDAAKGGDAKAALAILQHAHGWVAKQQIDVSVDQRISITAALEQADGRVAAVRTLENDVPALPRATSQEAEVLQYRPRQRQEVADVG